MDCGDCKTESRVALCHTRRPPLLETSKSDFIHHAKNPYLPIYKARASLQPRRTALALSTQGSRIHGPRRPRENKEWEGGRTVVSKARVLYAGCPIDWCSRAPRSGRTAHRVASRPPGRPLVRSVSSRRPRSARRAAVPSASCVRRAAAAEQASHGWPGQHRPIRPLAATLASSCRMTSPWPATAAHRPRASTSRCTRASSSLCRCAASRQPPRGERRWRGETERSQCEHARTRACLLAAGVQGRCAAGASSLHWYTAALTLEAAGPPPAL